MAQCPANADSPVLSTPVTTFSTLASEKSNTYTHDVEKAAGLVKTSGYFETQSHAWRCRFRRLSQALSGCQSSRKTTLEPLFKPRCRPLENYPEGYPQFAAFLSSDHNFMVYRGFSYLRSRVLLTEQYNLTELEKELDGIDRSDPGSEESEARLTSLNSEHYYTKEAAKTKVEVESVQENKVAERSRLQIIADIKHRLTEYDDFLLKSREIESLQRPTNRDYLSVCHWMNNEKPLVNEEMDYINCREDCITLRHGRECAGFDGFIESMLQKMNCKFIRYLFVTPELREKTSDENVHYYSPSRVDTLVCLIITAVIFILLILPVVAMYQLTTFNNHNPTFRAIGVLIVFTLLFSAAMSVLTRAQRHELFAASAAYCAVLVVFISNFGGNLS